MLPPALAPERPPSRSSTVRQARVALMGIVVSTATLAQVAPAAATSAASAASTTSAVAPGPVDVPVRVDLGAEIAAGRFDPQRDGVGLRGGRPPLSWTRSLPLQPRGDGSYTTLLRIDQPAASGQPLPYKFRIERPGLGPDEGWEPGRNHSLLVHLPGARIDRAFGVPAEPPPAQRTGTIVDLGIVASRHVPARRVEVWLPPSYDTQAPRRHPVLYLHDGQNVFDARAAGTEWQVDETAQRLALAGAIDAPIVVAVASGPDRMAEYTPTSMWVDARRSGQAAGRHVGGAAPALARFLIDELKPMIDARFRTRGGPADTAVGGSSLGGLLSLWLALEHPQTFGAALVVSPSLWWDDGLPLRLVDAARGPGAPRPRLWLDIGALEGERAVAEARRLRDALRRQGWTDARLAYVEAADGDHDEVSWAGRVEGMLRFLFPPGAAGR